MAVRDLDFDCRDGELTVLVGPSGSGKTTALRLAAGLESSDTGRISIAGRDVTRVRPADRKVAMVFQSFALFPHVSVQRNIGFGLAVRGTPKGEVARRVFEAAEVVGCEALLQRMPHELSGGEQQRVALARALVRDPDVFLLDEPLSNLDAQLRVTMRAEIRRVQREVRATMLYVTHDQFEALTLGDRVAVMHDGALQQEGAPDDVYRRPANRFVATFIGSPVMNILPGAVEGDMILAGPLRVPVPHGVDLSDARGLEVGVRPEHLRIEAAGGTGSDGGARGTGQAAVVTLVEPAGPDTFVHLTVGEQRLIVRAAPDVRPAVGERMDIVAAAKDAHLFDTGSGARLWSGVDA